MHESMPWLPNRMCKAFTSYSGRMKHRPTKQFLATRTWQPSSICNVGFVETRSMCACEHRSCDVHRCARNLDWVNPGLHLSLPSPRRDLKRVPRYDINLT